MNRILFLLFLFGLLQISGCSLQSESPEAKYERRVEQALASGQRSDSLFLGYYFGMTKETFFDHSWKLNNQRKVFQGQRSASIRYDLDYLKHNAHMTFFPEFRDDRIYKMPVRYMYNGWAPWNRNLWADSLKKDILNVLKNRYKQPFLKMNHPELGVPSHIAVVNNKRIAIFKASDQEVAVNYVDLSVLKENKIKE